MGFLTSFTVHTTEAVTQAGAQSKQTNSVGKILSAAGIGVAFGFLTGGPAGAAIGGATSVAGEIAGEHFGSQVGDAAQPLIKTKTTRSVSDKKKWNAIAPQQTNAWDILNNLNKPTRQVNPFASSSAVTKDQLKQIADNLKAIDTRVNSLETKTK